MQPPPQDPALGLFQALDDVGQLVPGAGAGGVYGPLPDAPTQLAMYRAMRLLRRLDERMLAKQRQGAVGFYGSVTGQEAVPIACGFATRPTDWVFPALRESAILLTRGFPLHTYLAQVYGNAGDVNKGRQMPSHMAHSPHELSQACVRNVYISNSDSVKRAPHTRQEGQRA